MGGVQGDPGKNKRRKHIIWRVKDRKHAITQKLTQVNYHQNQSNLALLSYFAAFMGTILIIACFSPRVMMDSNLDPIITGRAQYCVTMNES